MRWDGVTDLDNKIFDIIMAIDERVYDSCLDFGCGTGNKADFIHDYFGVHDYKGYDISKLATDEAKIKGLEIVNGLEDIKSVDMIWCYLSLQHIMDDGEFIDTICKFREKLNSGGVLYVIDNVSAKSDLSYIRFRLAEEHEKVYTACGFEESASAMITAGDEIVKIWRLV